MEKDKESQKKGKEDARRAARRWVSQDRAEGDAETPCGRLKQKALRPEENRLSQCAQQIRQCSIQIFPSLSTKMA